MMQFEVSPYSHLIRGAAKGLPCANCLEVEGLADDFDVVQLWGVMTSFFQDCEAKPAKVSYRTVTSKSSFETTAPVFQKRRLPELIGHQIVSLTVGAEEADDIDTVWTPRTYAAYGYRGKERGLLFYDSKITGGGCSAGVADVSRIIPTVDFALAWSFEYPLAFSPLAYFWGLSFDPNIRGVGATLGEDRERVARWMSHCHSGRSVAEGYFRDVYPEVLINRPTNSVERQSFDAWIDRAPWRGRLEETKFGLVWRMPAEHMGRVQAELDRSQLLLSGFR